jgi:hypothetical protein
MENSLFVVTADDDGPWHYVRNQYGPLLPV